MSIDGADLAYQLEYGRSVYIRLIRLGQLLPEE